MPRADNRHFDSYPDQTQAKHEILIKYFHAYMSALKNRVAGFHYIDGFAGKGSYEKIDGNGRSARQNGSPLLVLEELGNKGKASNSTISLVEHRCDYHAELADTIAKHPITPQLATEPLIERGDFSDLLPKILHRGEKLSGTTATFSFIDPCGISGVSLHDVATLLDLPFGEVLLFFNYNAVNRLLNAVDKGTHKTQILDELFGSNEMVQELLKKMRSQKSKRELIVMNQFIKALKIYVRRAKYFVHFKFDAKLKRQTSHYLVHCSCHHLGFKIMKSVMWKVAESQPGIAEGLQFLNDGERNQLCLASHEPNFKSILRDKILTELEDGPVQVSRFIEQWVIRPDDPYSEEIHKEIILALELEDRIAVFDKNNQNLRPRGKRRNGAINGHLYLRKKEVEQPLLFEDSQ